MKANLFKFLFSALFILGKYLRHFHNFPQVLISDFRVETGPMDGVQGLDYRHDMKPQFNPN